jgi:hypothetical protein
MGQRNETRTTEQTYWGMTYGDSIIVPNNNNWTITVIEQLIACEDSLTE